MSYENVEDLEAYRVERRIRAVEVAVQEDAIAENAAACEAFRTALENKDSFAAMRALERCDAARVRLINLMGFGE